jgi:hypothetical protein
MARGMEGNSRDSLTGNVIAFSKNLEKKVLKFCVSDKRKFSALNKQFHKKLIHLITGFRTLYFKKINPLSSELNPICYLLALLAHEFLHVSRIRVKSLTFRLLMLYIYIWSTYS